MKKFRELLLYGIIGGFSALLDFVVYSVLLNFFSTEYLLVANVVGVLCGIITSFTLNRKYNFKVKDKTGRRFLTFLTVGLTGLVISSSLIVILVDCMNTNAMTAKLLTIVVVSVIQFALNKFITFRKSIYEER